MNYEPVSTRIDLHHGHHQLYPGFDFTLRSQDCLLHHLIELD
jgi:hypothetical protein